MARTSGFLLRIVLLCTLSPAAGLSFGAEMAVSGAKVGVLRDSFAPDYPERAEAIVVALMQAGLKPIFVSGAALSDEETFASQKLDCLVLPDARFFPANPAFPRGSSLRNFLRSGGDMLVIGGPIFDKTLYRVNGRWQTGQEILRSIRPERVALDLSKLNRRDWSRAASNPDVVGSLSIRRAAHKGEKGWAQVFVENLSPRGWDTYRIRLARGAFPEAHSIVCFQASGDKNTPSMILEIQERDRSRWIAVVRLSPQTQSYALPVERFKFWNDSTSPGRGGRGDHLKLSNAGFLTIGLAGSHNVLPKGPHSFRISSIASAKSTLPRPGGVSIPVLETLYPWYKNYTTDTISRVEAADSGFISRGLTARLEKTEVVCPIWRSRGLGFRNPLPYRWIPLINGYDSRTRFRGTVASLLLNFEGEYANSHWLQVGLQDTRVVNDLATILGRLISDCIGKMRRNIFLRSGGVDRAAYFEGEEITLGCVLNVPPPRSYRARIRVWKTQTAGSPAAVLDETISLAGKPETSLNWRAPSGKSAAYQAVVELLDERNRVVDSLTHDFSILRDSPAAADEIVRAEGYDFVLRGRRWYPHGINYWPSNWGGRERNEFRQHWLSPGLYDPVVVERDLSLAKQLGMNSLSIQLNSLGQVPAVNDFLFRCGKFGIYVNLFLGGAHPLRPNFLLVTAFLTAGKFAGNPAIYAYDTAWEPHLGQEGERRRYDPQWAEWIEERYGGIENAEKDWKFSLRKENGGITTPTQNQILSPGPWNVMVSAYRRFLDDLISRGYREVTGRIREIDPTHLIGARTGYGGTGEQGIDPRMPFDLISGAKHLDFISPEGYGLSPDWGNARAAGLTTLYGRYAGNGKPVFWAEFGRSVHPNYDAAAFARQKNIYESMYRLVLDSFAQGSAGWWFPGGYRLGENSDYGIISPDMTPRPAAEILARYSPPITRQGAVPAPNAWITIDRDLHPRGYSQIRKRSQDEYLKLRREGKVVALRTAATGTNSATVADAAVGDVRYTGHNPHKYLNAEFNSVRLLRRRKASVELKKGEKLTVRKGQRVRLAVSVGNTGEPTWLAPRGGRLSRGDVYLSCSINGKAAKNFPIRQNVRRYRDCEFQELLLSPALLAPARVTLRMKAFQKASFGEKFEFSLNSQ